MKNIQLFICDKYLSACFHQVEMGIYRANTDYVVSLSFEQEPELGEGASPAHISQYPVEDILDRFCVYVSDFYSEINALSSKKCYLEFCSPHLKNIEDLCSIIGKHVYNTIGGSVGNEQVILVIEEQ